MTTRRLTSRAPPRSRSRRRRSSSCRPPRWGSPTPNSSSTTWVSSTRSRESTSSDSKVASGVTSAGSGPSSAIASTTFCSTVSRLMMVVAMAGRYLLVWFVGGDCFAAGSGAQTAVDGQRRAGHVGRLVRGEEAHAGGDLRRGAGAARGHAVQQPVADAPRSCRCRTSPGPRRSPSPRGAPPRRRPCGSCRSDPPSTPRSWPGPGLARGPTTEAMFTMRPKRARAWTQRAAGEAEGGGEVGRRSRGPSPRRRSGAPGRPRARRRC